MEVALRVDAQAREFVIAHGGMEERRPPITDLVRRIVPFDKFVEFVDLLAAHVRNSHNAPFPDSGERGATYGVRWGDRAGVMTTETHTTRHSSAPSAAAEGKRGGYRPVSLNAPSRRISGQSAATSTTTSSVPTPPAATAITGPTSWATSPDSKPPS